MVRLYKKVDKMSFKNTKEQIRARNLINLKNTIKISAKCRHYPALKTLLNLINLKKPKSILLFMPLAYEPDVYRLRSKISKKCDIFAPFMVDVSLKVVKLSLPFHISKFKVREPIGKMVFNKVVDMAVVPVIGVDGAMRRIGHGKGFYDRFFSQMPKPPKTIVFVQIIDLYTNEKIAQKHDISCDFYITPKKNYVKRGKYDRNFSGIRSRCGGCWRRIHCS